MSRSDAQTVTLNPLRADAIVQTVTGDPHEFTESVHFEESRSRDAPAASPSRAVLVGIGSPRPRQR